MDLNLGNQVALVTASTAGIGFAIADRLVEEGATVILNGRTEARVSTAAEALKQKHPRARLRAFFSKWPSRGRREIATRWRKSSS